jgi:hypothetical protein
MPDLEHLTHFVDEGLIRSGFAEHAVYKHGFVYKETLAPAMYDYY